MTHIFKFESDYYKKVKEGKVNFIITKDERFLKVDDTLILQPNNLSEEILATITHISNEKGIQKGYIVVNFENK